MNDARKVGGSAHHTQHYKEVSLWPCLLLPSLASMIFSCSNSLHVYMNIDHNTGPPNLKQTEGTYHLNNTCILLETKSRLPRRQLGWTA